MTGETRRSRPSPRTITQVLAQAGAGSPAAYDELFPLVYAELRRIAAREMRHERPGRTLQTTALVHEAYLRLLGSRQVGWQNRAHFFALAARLMRRVLVDAVRAQQSQKRGGRAPHLPLEDSAPAPLARRDLVALDDALNALAEIDPAKARIVELRYFGGLTGEEAAEVMGLSRVALEREWRVARLWLARELKGATP